MCSFRPEAERRRLPGGWRKDLRRQTSKVVKAEALIIWSMIVGAISGVLTP